MLFQPDGRGFKAARAMNERVYPGVRLDRTVVVTDAFLLDAFRVTSERSRQFDWAMHCVGTPRLPERCRPGTLGEKRGYRHFADVRRLPGSGPACTMTWERARGLTHAALVLPSRATVWIARDPMPAADKMHTIGEVDPLLPRHTLLVRTRGRSALYLSAWSYGDAPVPVRLVEGTASTDLVIRVGVGSRSRTWRLPVAREPIADMRALASRQPGLTRLARLPWSPDSNP